MESLKEQDSTEKHRSRARYHQGACTQSKVPAISGLADEIEPLCDDMIAKERQIEDAQDQVVIATAVADGEEIVAEDIVRDVHAELGSQDRKDPTLGSQVKVFPHGFGPVINEENEDQFAPLATLHVDIAPFVTLEPVAALMATLDAQEVVLGEKLEVKKGANDRVTTLKAELKIAKTKVREQLQSAYGRLRDIHKSNPKLAERYFDRPKKRKPSR
jgi:hypothetical protein